MKLIDNDNDLLFRGEVGKVNPSFVDDCICSCDIISEVLSETDTNNISLEKLKVIVAEANDAYVIMFESNVVKMGDSIIKPFIDVTIINKNIELLFFFGVNEVNGANNEERIAFIHEWSKHFCSKYGFEYYKFQMDGADEDEYYFDSYGLGPLAYR